MPNLPDARQGELPRLYAILDIDSVFARGLQPLDVLDAWLDAGVRLVQLRAKGLTFGPVLELADSMRRRCTAGGASFIVNDRADVARLAGADGVHLGQHDLRPDEARSVYPEAGIIGLSTHDAAQLRDAMLTEATYLAMGPVFATGTKANPDPVVGLEGVQEAATMLAGEPIRRPLVAIGGIALATAPRVVAAGADSVAVISALIDGPPGLQARAFLTALA